MKRLFLIIVSLALIVSLIAVPAFAATFELSDFVSSVTYDGDIKKVIYAFSSSLVEWHFHANGTQINGTGSFDSGDGEQFDIDPETSYRLVFYPLGARNRVDVSALRSGGTVEYLFELDCSFASNVDLAGKLYFYLYCYDSEGTVLSISVVDSWQWTTDATGERYQFWCSFDLPDNVSYVNPYIVFFGDIAYRTQFNVTTEPTRFMHNINMVAENSQLMSAINDKLDGIQNSIDEGNQAFDDFVNYDPQPSSPSWSDDFDDVSGKEDAIIDQLDPDQVQSNLGDMHLTVFDQLLLHVNAFQCIQLIFTAFLKVPILNVLVNLSLLLGLVASFLGIGISVGRAVSRHESKSGRR